MSTASSDKIGMLTATIVGMNAMIGAGIFAIPSVLADKVGPAGILTFAFVALSVWFIAQSLARIAQLYPQEGSFYTYAKQWGGHTVGLIASACYLIGLLIAMGLLSHAAGEHLVRYFPTTTAYTAGLASLISLTILNIIGVSLSSLGQQILIVLTVFPLLGTTLICLTKANTANLVPFAPHGIKAIFQETRVVAFAFFGFESTASLFNIIRDPQKNVPKAITYSLTAVALLYLAFVMSLILAVPLDLFAQYPGPVSGPLSVMFPNNPWLLEMIHISLISAILGTLHSMIWSSGALLLSFVKKLRNNRSRQLVAFGIINQTTCTSLIGLAIFASFSLLSNELFFNFTAMFLVIAFILSMITLLRLKTEWQSGQNIITMAGLLTACLLFYFAAENCFDSFNAVAN